jgi:hypothetical protein
VTGSRLKSGFYKSRKRPSSKLQKPRITRISFHTFRHWKATTLYHQTKDTRYVKQGFGDNLSEVKIYGSQRFKRGKVKALGNKMLFGIRGSKQHDSYRASDRPPIYILTKSTKKARLSIKKAVKSCFILTSHKFKSKQYLAVS